MKLPSINPQMVRFVFIGLLNTAIDFAIFHVLANQLAIPFFIANIVSTTSALGLSFFLNARYTFGSRITKRNGVLFIGVTLSGLWLLQPVIIFIAKPLLATSFSGLEGEVILLIAKIIATLASLVWNFILYKQVVFTNGHSSDITHRQPDRKELK